MKLRVGLVVAVVLLLAVPFPGMAQEKKAEAALAAWPVANPKDVDSLDAILAAVYDVISGPAGDRDWNRFRSLFVPEGRLIPIRKNADGSFTHQILSVDDYANRAGDFFKKEGFFEKEITHKTDRFGQLAVVFTTYASRHTADMNEKPFARGINSMTFYNDGKRWWCLSIIWDSERPDNPIPEKYLK
jgi:hypothetical protein